MSLSDYLEPLVLDDCIVGDYLSSACYVALFNGSPTDTGSGGTEVSGGSYARVSHTSWNAASGGKITNNGAITFATATAAWGDVTHFALFDASTGGNMLLWGTFGATLTVSLGDTPFIADADMDVAID